MDGSDVRRPVSIVDHYGADDLVARVERELENAGLGDRSITAQSLAPLDQFHVGGLAATVELAKRLDPRAGERVLDLGSGIGGSARYLAATFGVYVHGIDFSPSFVAVANMLTARAGLAERVTCTVGDVTRIDVAAAGFDIAWTQHVAMNVEDRVAMYRGAFDALRPGGRFGIYDIVAGNGEPLHFPVPFAREPSQSFLLSSDETKDALQSAGFTIVDWTDETEAGLATVPAPPASPSRLSLAVVIGDEFPVRVANLAQSLREGRVRIAMGVARRP